MINCFNDTDKLKKLILNEKELEIFDKLDLIDDKNYFEEMKKNYTNNLIENINNNSNMKIIHTNN